LICTLYDFLPSKSILKYCLKKHQWENTDTPFL
jgi:hypothetical protein